MLISPQDIALLSKDHKVRVFDCRFSLADPEAGFRQYQEEHIPGAVYLHLERDLSAAASPDEGRHPLPSPLNFAVRMSKAGVDDDTVVVFYDTGEGMAARGWWLMRYIGHEQVYLLNGGFEHWREQGLPVTDKIPAPVHALLHVRLQTHMVADESDVEQVVQGQQAGYLLDARAVQRYRGDEEPIDPKAGHIPGAKNAPWTESTAQNGTWLSSEDQQRRFEGVPTDGNSVIHYCGSGVTACNNVFAMELAGLPSGRLYPGSWSQWSGKANHPIATGDDA